ncbi:hypothetical protein C0J52_16353 [Blattella germanica]|nr:hypothetical protein C0J52_16353 [Blattella germanica]
MKKFRRASVPNKSTIHRLVCKVRERGAFADKKRNRKRIVLTEEKLDDIGACFEQSPHKSLSKLAQQSREQRSVHVYCMPLQERIIFED